MPEVERARCRSCDELIVWALTANERRMPVDAEPHEAGNLRLYRRKEDGAVSVVVVARSSEAGLHRPHFATCAQAAEWRKQRVAS